MKKILRILLYLASFLLLAGCVFWFLLTQTSLLEGQVNRLLRVLVQNKYSLKVNVGDISGSFWKELIIRNLTVDFVQEGESFRVADIPYLKADYRLSNLWRKKWIIDSLRVDHPKLAVKKAEEGKLVAAASPKGKTLSKLGLFDFSVGVVKIDNGVFQYVDSAKQATIDSLNLALSLTKEKDEFQMKILQGGFSYLEKNLAIQALEGSLSLRSDTLLVQRLHVKTRESDLEISGGVSNLQEPRFSFSVKADPANLDDIRKLTGVGLDGRLSVDGTWEGNLGEFGGKATLDGLFFGRRFDKLNVQYSCQNGKLTFPSIGGNAFGSFLTGRGELDLTKKPEEYEFHGNINDLNLNNIIFGNLPTRFSGKVDLRGRSFSPKDMVMEAAVNLQAGKIERYSFSAASGTMDITTTAIVFQPQFLLDYKNTQVVLDGGELQYAGNVDISAQVMFGDLKDFWNQIFIKEMMGRGKAWVKISGKTEDFDINGKFTSDSCYVYQLFSRDAKLELSLANFITKPKGDVKVLFLDGNAWGLDYDSLASRLEVDNQWIKIDSTRLRGQSFDLGFWGELDASKTPQTLLLHQMVLDYRGNRLETLSPTVVDIDTEKVDIKKFILSGKTGEVTLSGRIDYEERMDLSLKLAGLDVAPWAALLTPEPVGGNLSLDAQLKGDFQNPQISSRGEIRQLKLKGMELGDLKADLRYGEKKLEIQNLAVTKEDWEYVLSGILPIDLSFYAAKQRVLEEPQSLRLHAKGKRLELIRWFIPDIEYLTGDFDGDLNISGTLFHPQLDGKMSVRDGRLKFAQLVDPVEGLSVDMRMENENLILDNVDGFVERKESEGGGPLRPIWKMFSQKKGFKGEVNGFGTINLKDVNDIDYDLYFSGNKVPLNYEYADLSGIGDFSLEITGKGAPLVSAQIILSELSYREPFASSSSESPLAPTYSPENLWDWDFDISAANNCWIINNDVNLEFDGEVRVLREGGELRILGDLETIRGKYFLYGTTFNIEKGSFTFDNIKKIDPKIDFSVSSRVRGAAPSSTGQGSLVSTGSTDEITLAIKGTISEPEVQPETDSPYSQEDILGLLAFQRGLSSVDSASVGTLFQERVIKSLGGAYSSRFLENIAGQTLGVETFEIVPAWSEKFHLTDAQITVGKYVSEKIYLHYTRRLSQSSGQESGVEYRLNKHLLLEGRKDNQGLFHFGLNLNYEY
ncbi:MAG: translocation/assembly module TamB domain-containing protein [Candidatus Zixiibacteriota bacterium]